MCQSNIAHPSNNRMQITVKNIIKSNVKTIAQDTVRIKNTIFLYPIKFFRIRGIFPRRAHITSGSMFTKTQKVTVSIRKFITKAEKRLSHGDS